MDANEFCFKQFSVKHLRSSMKVGVDAVLLGCWCAKNFHPKDILDIGTGCGVISLIIAQRFPKAKILGIDIDSSSVKEAQENFDISPWVANLQARQEFFPDETIAQGEKYDLIVSNPPYFRSGIYNPLTPREKARHQSNLSPLSILQNCGEILVPQGRLSMIFPMELLTEVKEQSFNLGFDLMRICYVRDNINRPEKRVILELAKKEGEDCRMGNSESVNKKGEIEEEHLVLFSDREPTPSYRTLCKDFYLKF